MEKNVRQIDNLGRIVIPKDMRKALDIGEFDELAISLDKNRIIIEKAKDSCIFCGTAKDLSEFKGKFICENCKKTLLK